MIDRKAKLAKIRKCLALAKSANEHEAAAALAMAGKLMEELGLSEADATLLDVSEEAARGSRRLTPSRWESILSSSVARAIGVSKFIDENLDWRFVGREAAPEIAAYAFQVLHRQLKRARADYIATQLRRCKPANKRARADAFCEGWSSVIYAKVAKLRPAFEDELVERYMVERHPDLVTTGSRAANLKRASNDFWKGHDRGSAVDLHAGVGATAPALIGSAA